jgi:hypothetical protein
MAGTLFFYTAYLWAKLFLSLALVKVVVLYRILRVYTVEFGLSRLAFPILSLNLSLKSSSQASLCFFLSGGLNFK